MHTVRPCVDGMHLGHCGCLGCLCGALILAAPGTVHAHIRVCRYEQGGNVSQLHELEAVGRSLGLLDVPHHIQAGTYRPAVAAEDRAAKKE